MEDMQNKFSVLMSVYINEKEFFLEEALKSILTDQILSPDEFILVCDGPLTLGLENIIQKYKTLYPNILKVHKLPENVGLGKALNYGLEKCSFELIARADSDDICTKDRFLKQMEYFKNNKNLVALGTDIDEFDEDYRKPKTIKKMPTSNEDILKMSKYRNPLNHMSVMFRKSKVQEVGSYKDLFYLEDFYLWIRLIAKGYELNNIPEVLVHARVGDGMLARRSNKRYIESWRTLNRYKLDNKLINKYEYGKNMIGVRAFIYAPIKLKEFMYKKLLRR